jgi:hypothetical protein
MKKQGILLLMMMAIWNTSMNGQICDPDTTMKDPGFRPVELPEAIAGFVYNEKSDIRIISDTLVDFNGFPVRAKFDSIVLINVLGLPNGFSYECLRPNCSFVSNETRCVMLNGNPKPEDVGIYPLTFLLRAHLDIQGLKLQQTDSLSVYTLKVNDEYGSLSSNFVEENSIKTVDIWPNPARSEIRIRFNERPKQQSTFQIYTIDGRKVIHATLENHAIDISLLTDGIYFLQIDMENGQKYVHKFFKVTH